ncbi:NlpC/P60 family protein [Streptomyces sp. NPDC004065]|uniref:C40 family peptidase n=1 Tax=Streptomyces sp. NPDC004065 TaxID=3364689 RepID=UPI00384E2CA8
MASHRKTGPAAPAVTRVAGLGTPALATAALTSVALFPQSAEAADPGGHGGHGARPSVEEVEKKIDDLYRRAEYGSGDTGRTQRTGRTTEKAGRSAKTENAGRSEKAENADGADRADADRSRRAPAGARTGRQRGLMSGLFDDAPKRTDVLTRAREMLSAFTAAQGRPAADAPEDAAALLANTPQGYFDQAQVLSRLTARRTNLTTGPAGRRPSAATAPEEHAAPATLPESPATAARTAPVTPAPPTTRPSQPSQPSQAAATPHTGVTAPTAPAAVTAPAQPPHDIRAAKAAVQRKLADARALLRTLALQQRTVQAESPAPRPAAPGPLAHAPAHAPLPQPPAHDPLSPPPAHDHLTRPPAPEPAPRSAPRSAPQPPSAPPSAPLPPTQPYAHPSPSSLSPSSPAPSSSSPAPSSPSSRYAARAESALAFARAQIGKPCVWGAAGPGSYDCSGLTAAAWKAAGVPLPRTARAQREAGTAVPLSEALPGDLVFFHEDGGHVGICAGDGMVIHAPGPGACVREDPVHQEGGPAVHSVVRPA